MKRYDVYWSEDHSVNVEAKNEKEAIEKIWNGDYDDSGESAEMNGGIDAEEIKLK